MNELWGFLHQYTPLAVIGVCFAVGFIYRTMKPKTECQIQVQAFMSRFDNIDHQQDWMVSALLHLLTANGVEGELPPPPRNGGEE